MKEIALIIVPFFSVFTSVFVLMLCLTYKKSFFFVINSFAIITLASGILNISLILNGYFELNDKIKIFQSFLYLPLVILLFKELLFQRMFAFFMLMTIISFLRLLGITLSDFFIPYGEHITYLMLIIITFILYFIYLLLVLKLGRKLFKKVFAYGHEKEWIIYLLSAAASWLILEFIPPLFQSNLTMALVIMSFVIWSFFILLFAIINTHERMKQKYEADFARDIISTGREHYRKMNEQYDVLKIMRHDYKFHLNTALDMLRRGETEKSNEYLIGLQNKLEENELLNFCDNPVINSLIADYARKCRELNIDFNVLINIPPDFKVMNYEMCIVLGNLLENAVEACLKIENERQIKLVVKPQGEQLTIMLRNTYNGEVVLDGEKFISTKDNGLNIACGIGLESVMAVIGSFGEMFHIKYDNKWFNVFAVWKQSEQ
ncbi:MAG: GHKL domain-containing protein [Treponema sp.]|nr:GHKL domain-containing protein [Treponema sp.]MCL2251152.1 GHKL domain-containing protein [Treponema sp.]